MSGLGDLEERLRALLDEARESGVEDELVEAFESRMGPGLARTMAAKCKANSLG